MKKISILAGILLLTATLAQAHTNNMEILDFSYARPFVIKGGPTDSAFMPNLPNALAIMKSRAIYSFLYPGDYDVYKMTISPADCRKFDPATGTFVASPVLIAASAMPPACYQYEDFYPSVALVGPGLPAPTESLPFPIPAGCGAIVKHNPASDNRSIFAMEMSDNITGVSGEIKWFLPKGLTQECLLSKPWLCNFSNTIAQPVYVSDNATAQDFYVVIYDKTRKIGNYTANLGMLEYLDTAQTMEIPLTIEEEPMHHISLSLALKGLLYYLPCTYID